MTKSRIIHLRRTTNPCHCSTSVQGLLPSVTQGYLSISCMGRPNYMGSSVRWDQESNYVCIKAWGLTCYSTSCSQVCSHPQTPNKRFRKPFPPLMMTQSQRIMKMMMRMRNKMNMTLLISSTKPRIMLSWATFVMYFCCHQQPSRTSTGHNAMICEFWHFMRLSKMFQQADVSYNSTLPWFIKVKMEGLLVFASSLPLTNMSMWMALTTISSLTLILSQPVVSVPLIKVKWLLYSISMLSILAIRLSINCSHWSIFETWMGYVASYCPYFLCQLGPKLCQSRCTSSDPWSYACSPPNASWGQYNLPSCHQSYPRWIGPIHRNQPPPDWTQEP